jgi:hypothetical protein
MNIYVILKARGEELGGLKREIAAPKIDKYKVCHKFFPLEVLNSQSSSKWGPS